MAGIILLVGLCIVMAAASFLAGALPLSMTLSQQHLRLLSSIGAGLLVGTSLIIIIPEGMEAAASPAELAHSHHNTRSSLISRRPWSSAMVPIPQFAEGAPVIQAAESRTNKLRDINTLLPESIRSNRFGTTAAAIDEGSFVKSQPPTSEESSEGSSETEEDDSEAGSGAPHDDAEEEEEEEEEEGGGGGGGGGEEADEELDEDVEFPAFSVGFAMILGFALMFLIDRLPRHIMESFGGASQPHYISLENLAGSDAASIHEEEEGFLGSLTPTPRRARSLATTIGLVIHAAADGIAMGATSAASNLKLGFVVFIAIMIHKAPAAFGLTSVLLKQGLSKRAARGHLIVFSSAAPVGALATWLLLTVLGAGRFNSATQQWWTGLLLLFSGGTFLYVAIQAMQEEDDSHPHGHAHGQGHGYDHAANGSNGYGDGGTSSPRKARSPGLRETAATVVGMLLPLFIQVGHHQH